jgi:hypothetical protein
MLTLFTAQIAAKAKTGRDLEIEEREAHHTKGTFSSTIQT